CSRRIEGPRRGGRKGWPATGRGPIAHPLAPRRGHRVRAASASVLDWWPSSPAARIRYRDAGTKMASQTQRDGVASVADHYDRLLAEHYTWMSGDFAEKVSEQRALLSSLGLPRSGSRRALDLGSGPGFQSIALAEIGYEVTALDTSRKLLAELTDRKGSLPIAAVEADIAAGLPMIEPGVEVALCMGDTLTHLSSKDDVLRLFTEVHRLLAPGGRFVLGFRDLTAELRGTDRFIPVRSDSHRIMTCFLEYEPE